MANEYQPLRTPPSTNKFWGWPDALNLRGTVLPHVVLPVSFVVAWSAVLTVIHETLPVNVELSNSVVTSVSVVLGLLLAFRTNTSYDRFWEGRKLFATITTDIRILARLIWIGVPESVSSLTEKRRFFDLLIAYVVAVKHHLRDEFGTHYVDLRNVLPPGFHAARNISHADARHRHEAAEIEVSLDPEVCMNLPQEIALHMSLYQERLFRMSNGMEGAIYGNMSGAIAQMTDCFASMDRIHSTPLPPAYRIHMRQSLMTYCLLLPFTFVERIGVYTPCIILVIAFVLLGIQEIGSEIEDPFGYDPNDIPMDEYCEEIRLELRYLVSRVPQRLCGVLIDREPQGGRDTGSPSDAPGEAPILPPKDRVVDLPITGTDEATIIHTAPLVPETGIVPTVVSTTASASETTVTAIPTEAALLPIIDTSSSSSSTPSVSTDSSSAVSSVAATTTTTTVAAPAPTS